MKKANLIWIDLEMTGLDPVSDVILEIASVITDDELNEIDEGPALVIHYPESTLAAMGKWCQDQHKKSGLSDAVRSSSITLEEAEKKTLSFIKKYCDKNKGILCGNTVWMDRIFLARYMPSIVDHLHYKLIDVTGIQQVIKRWFPKNPFIEFKKGDIHRALPDIRESIAELRHYKLYFFNEPQL